MPKNSQEQKEAISARLQIVSDDLERLYSQEQTPQVEAAIAALKSELEDLINTTAQLDERIAREKVKAARLLRYKGLRLGEIAEQVGLSKTSVQRVCRDIPVDRRATPRMPPPPWLEKAKSMAAQGKTRRVIALELNIPIANFYRAYNRFARS